MLSLKFLNRIKFFPGTTQLKLFQFYASSGSNELLRLFPPPSWLCLIPLNPIFNVCSNNQHNTVVNNGCTKECTRMVLVVCHVQIQDMSSAILCFVLACLRGSFAIDPAYFSYLYLCVLPLCQKFKVLCVQASSFSKYEQTDTPRMYSVVKLK